MLILGWGGCLHPVNLFVSFCFLVGKFLLSHGTFAVLDIVMYTMYDLIIIVIVEELLVLAFVFLFSFFVTITIVSY
jgi:hypothetical protein